MASSDRSRQARGGAVHLLPPIVVATVAVGLLATQLLPGPQNAGGAVPPLLVLLQAVVLLARRQRLLTVLVLVAVLDAAVLVVTHGAVGSGAVAVGIASYALLRRGADRRDLATLVAVSAGTFTVSLLVLLADPTTGVALAWVASVVRVLLQNVAPAIAGDVVRGRRRLVAALRERAEYVERDRARQIETALNDQRIAIARELHDVAAHHLSGMVVAAQAARRLLPDGVTDADEYLGSIERGARQALTDLRATVGLLRADGGDALDPLPGIGEVPRLVDAARARGQVVELELDEGATRLTPVQQTTVVRMVQESLANAAQHAPGSRVRVAAVVGDGSVQVTVENGRATAPEQPTDSLHLGLVGMRERATLVGGELSTGRRDDGGWRNRLTIRMPADDGQESM